MFFLKKVTYIILSDAAAQRQQDPPSRLENTKKELLKVANDLFVRLFQAFKL